MSSWWTWISAIPGVTALVAWGIGYGKLLGRVKSVEGELSEVKKELTEFRATAILVARIDERTKGTQEVVGRMDSKLNDTLGAMVRGEPRSFTAA